MSAGKLNLYGHSVQSNLGGRATGSRHATYSAKPEMAGTGSTISETLDIVERGAERILREAAANGLKKRGRG